MNEKLNFITNEGKSYEESKIVVLPLALEETTSYKKGTCLGPRKIIESSLNLEFYEEDFGNDISEALGIFTDNTYIDKMTGGLEKSISDIENIVDRHLKNNKFVVSLGGEHTLTLPIVRAFSKHFDDISVLHLDAHTDFRDSYEGHDLCHCTFLRKIWEEITPNFLSFGIRAASKEEILFIKEHNISNIHIYDGYKKMDDYLEVCKNLSKNVYLTIDTDFFDPSVIPHVGTPEPGGVFWYDFVHFIKKLVKMKNIVGLDLVELCPNEYSYVSDYVCARLIYKLMGICLSRAT